MKVDDLSFRGHGMCWPFEEAALFGVSMGHGTTLRPGVPWRPKGRLRGVPASHGWNLMVFGSSDMGRFP